MQSISKIRTLILTAILLIGSIATTYAYTPDDGIKFKGKWLKRYLLIPTNDDYVINDGKTIQYVNDDLQIEISRDTFISRLILDVINRSGKKITIPVNKCYLRIGDSVHPFKVRDNNADNKWEINKPKRKNTKSRCYIQTVDECSIALSEETASSMLFIYRIDNDSHNIEIRFKIIPYEDKESEE